ncbi:MAG: GNAT family N-acetyltransferase [Alphaproteobacteria bacterium]|nr:GNAT family N-acetyltransferase [Alphaproteobacteria bacterium]
MSKKTIQTDRLTLRRPRPSDLEPYTAYCRGDRTTFVGGPHDGVEAFNKLSAIIGHWQLRGFGRYIFVETATERPIGHVGALQMDADWEPDMTWSIWHGDDEGKGYAFEASRAYCEHAARELQFPKMAARIVRQNHASIRLAEQLGGVLNSRSPAPPWFPDAMTYEIDLQHYNHTVAR